MYNAHTQVSYTKIETQQVLILRRDTQYYLDELKSANVQTVAIKSAEIYTNRNIQSH